MNITKEEAIKLNQKWFYTGLACKNNHIDKRYVNTGICYTCKRNLNKGCNSRNKNTLKAISIRSYLNHKNEKLAASKRWALSNPDKVRLIKAKNKVKHRFKYLQTEKLRQKLKRKTDPYFRLSKNMSKAIWQNLSGQKGYSKWLNLVDYTFEELKIHLESKFKCGMNWDNYGSYWHVDHVKPLSWFTGNEFKEAWSLSNLQPLEASINLSKCNRYIG